MKPSKDMKQRAAAWGMIAASIAWNKTNKCTECNGTWRKKDFTLCECHLDAPFTLQEIEKVMAGVIDIHL